MSIWGVLQTIAAESTFDEVGDKEFPCDYEDTYDLGVRNGRIQLARELLKNRVSVVVPEENFLRDEDDSGC